MIGEKIFQVNREDRQNSYDSHRFIVWTVTGLIKRYKGYVILLTQRDYILEKDKKFAPVSEKQKFLQYYGSLHVFSNNIKDCVEILNEQSLGGNFYLEKEKSQPELLKLAKGQIEDFNRCVESYSEAIKNLKKTFDL